MLDPSEFNPSAIALFSEILMAEQMMKSRLSRVLPKGMELSHFMLLNLLANQTNEKSPGQLARMFQLTKGAMSNTLNKLEGYGYIHIRPDWDDARRKRVMISDSGLLARLDAIRLIQPIFEDVINKLGSKKVKSALPFLRELRQALDVE